MPKKSLRIFSLNLWFGHRIGLIQYLENQVDKYDVFCFYEVTHNCPNYPWFHEEGQPDLQLFSQLKKVFNNFEPYFAPYIDETFGIVTFVRRNIPHEFEAIIHLVGERPWEDFPAFDRHKNALSILVDGVRIFSFHGLYTPTISEESLKLQEQQAIRILDFIGEDTNRTIIIGDFNTEPESLTYQTIATGFQDLTHIYNIERTVTGLTHYDQDECIDHAFVGKRLTVDNYFLDYSLISDHASLHLTISY